MTPEAVALLSEILRGVRPLPGALCPDHPHVFHASADNPDPETRDYAITTAVRLCRACPALQQCAAWLDRTPATQRPPGVIAGQLINGKEPHMPQDNITPKAAARDHQRALRALLNYAQGDIDVMPALAAEIGEDVDWFVLALLTESVDHLDRQFGRDGAIAYLTGRLAAATDAAERDDD